LPPSPARSSSRKLDTSVGVSGPRDFTSASVPFVRTNIRARRQRVHRMPASRVVTIGRNAPRDEAGCADKTTDLGSMSRHFLQIRTPVVGTTGFARAMHAGFAVVQNVAAAIERLEEGYRRYVRFSHGSNFGGQQQVSAHPRRRARLGLLGRASCRGSSFRS
jgi:hypothetical protein